MKIKDIKWLDKRVRKISKKYDEKRKAEIHEEALEKWREGCKAIGAHPSLWDPNYVYVPKEEKLDPDPDEYWGLTGSY